MAERRKAKRNYMSSDQRRQQLLEVAAGMVDRDGWNGLTMISLAENAGVSRQLVYQHFKSLEDLLLETIDFLFGSLYKDAQQDFSRHSMLDAAAAHHRHYFEDLTEGRVRALWAVLFTPYQRGVPIGKAGRLLRRLSADLSAPDIPAFLGADVPEHQRRHIAFLMDMVFWGTYSLVSDGEIDKDEALELLLWALKRFRSGKRAGPPPAVRPRK